MSPATRQALAALVNEWLLSLRHRPLLWVACAIGSGTALGHELVPLAVVDLLDPWAWLAAVPVAACLFGLAGRRFERPDAVRLALFFVLLGVSCVRSVRRFEPPAHDVSSLVRGVPIPVGPQKPVSALVQGWVADYPRVNQFNVQFPLLVDTIRPHGERVPLTLPGRIWMQVPRDTTIEVGDALAAQVELTDLPRAGNPGERSRDLESIADGCWCVGRASNVQVLNLAPKFPLRRSIARLRRNLVARFMRDFGTTPATLESRPYPTQNAQLLGAMVLGEAGLSRPLPQITLDQFRSAGLAHTLVASGTQVVCLLAIVLGLTRLFGLRRWLMALVVVPLLICYALLAGGGPSIWRATLVGLCLVWALWSGRDVDGPSLWSLAFALLVWVEPTELFQLGFQLTFAATWGLLTLTPPLLVLVRSALGVFAASELLSFTVAAQLANTPVQAFHFGRLTLAGFVASLFGLPLAALLVATSMLGLLVPGLDIINYWLTRGMWSLASFTASLPGAQARVDPLSFHSCVVLYLLMLICAATPKVVQGGLYDAVRDDLKGWWHARRTRGFTPPGGSWFATAAVAVLVVLFWWLAARESRLRVAVLDVGQGEAIVIHSPAGRTVLVDGGSLGAQGRNDVGDTVILPYLQSIGVSRIDAMVVTHPDADHCNALRAVLDELPVDECIDGLSGALPHTNVLDQPAKPEYEELMAALHERGVPVVPAIAGQRLDLGDGASMTVLAPLQPPFLDDNDNGAVLRVDYGKTSVLLTADIERAAEERLVHRGVDLHCTVLKIAHHGSETSTCEDLLRAAHPQLAVLSCGRYNKFGLPAASTLQRLQAHHIPVYRTDVSGAVEIFSDSNNCWVQTFR